MTAKKIQDFSKGDLVEWNPGRFYYGTQNPGRPNSKNNPPRNCHDLRKRTNYRLETLRPMAHRSFHPGL